MFVATPDTRTNLDDMPVIILSERDLEPVMIEPALKIEILVNLDRALRLGGGFAVLGDPVHQPVRYGDDWRVVVELVLVSVRVNRTGCYDVAIVGSEREPLVPVLVGLAVSESDGFWSMPKIIMTEALAGPNGASLRQWLSAFLRSRTQPALDIEFEYA